MSSYLNQGGLWDNQRKYSPQDPDFVGSINIAGVEVQVVGWMSNSTNPKAPTINLKVNSAPVPMPQQAPKVEDKKDDIPF